MILEVGNSYQMADERIVYIGHVTPGKASLLMPWRISPSWFRTAEGDRDSWSEDGKHASGNDSLRLIARVLGSAPAPTLAPISAPISAPIAAPTARLGRYVVDLDAMTVRRI